jgi:hypothetical protein
MRFLAFLRHLHRDASGEAETLRSEIEEEFSHHLAQIERELIEAGFDAAAARREARTRFGDVDRQLAACIRIAREELLMVHKLITAALLITTVLLAFVSAHFYRLTRQAVQEAHMNAELALHERDRAMAVTQMLTEILVSHDVAQSDDETVQELLDEAAREADSAFHDQPEVAAKLRQAIEEALQRSEPEPE